MEKLDDPWPFSIHGLGRSRLEKNTTWIGEGAVSVVPGSALGQVPEGKTMTFQIMAQSIPQSFLYDRRGYSAPKFERMSIWWIPGKGGKLGKVTQNGKTQVELVRKKWTVEMLKIWFV